MLPPSPITIIGIYLAMPFLEIYAKVKGIYRPKFPETKPPYRNFPPDNVTTVLCIGDSLTAGYGSKAGNAYPDILRRRWSDLNIDVVNRGVNGSTAYDGLQRLENDLSSANNICCVIVGFGGNDLMQRIPLRDTFAHLTRIVKNIQDRGIGVVILGIRGSWLYKVDMEEPFYRLACETGCPLVPLALDGIWGNPFLMYDPAHPNSRGYEVLARKIADVLEPVVLAGTKKPRT